jgi:mannose-6-phosphate isomerase-like protein (cupin superfamily)
MKIPAPKIQLAIFTLALLAPLAAADAPPPPPTEVVVLDHGKVDAAFAKGTPLLVNSRYKIQTGRRVMAGQAEVHASDTDIFYVTEGSATLVTGGSVVDPKTTAVGEVRAEKISNGTPRKLTKGDVVVIPAGIAHQFTEVSGTFLYFVIKITK